MSWKGKSYELVLFIVKFRILKFKRHIKLKLVLWLKSYWNLTYNFFRAQVCPQKGPPKSKILVIDKVSQNKLNKL